MVEDPIRDTMALYINDIYKRDFFLFTEDELLEYLELYNDDSADYLIEVLEFEGKIIDSLEPNDAFDGFIKSLSQYRSSLSKSVFTLNILKGDAVVVYVATDKIRFTSTSEEALERICEVMFSNGYYTYSHEAMLYRSRPVYTYTFDLDKAGI